MDPSLHHRLQTLGDLELAVLLCLIAEQHCIITCAADVQSYVQQELQLTVATTFGLHAACVPCSEKTTVDSFNTALFVPADQDPADANAHRSDNENPPTFSPPSLLSQDDRSSRPSTRSDHYLDDRRIADVLIIKDLNLTAPMVQTQALELMRTKRLFARTAMHVAPKEMLVIALLSAEPSRRMTPHLNDLFALSHFHALEDELPHLDALDEGQNMLASPPPSLNPTIAHPAIVALKTLSANAKLTAEVSCYLHNIPVFLRLHRLIASGVTAAATRQLARLVRALAPLHGLAYVPPSLVALAVRKVYAHRVVLATPETERSVQWGSDVGAVRELFDGLTTHDAIEDVLASVEAPL